MGRRNTPKWEICCLQNQISPLGVIPLFFLVIGQMRCNNLSFIFKGISQHFHITISLDISMGWRPMNLDLFFLPWHPNILPRSLDYLLLLAHRVCQFDVINVMDQRIPHRRKGEWDPWELNDTGLKSWSTPEVGQKRHIDGFLAERKLLVLFMNRHWEKKIAK